MEEIQIEETKQLLFKIPQLEGKQAQTYLIGVIDASGSMEDCWSNLAKAWNENVPEEIIYTIITFDDNARIAPTKKLDSDIEQHGGRSTDIPKGFQLFEKKLEELPENAFITCIFISDGEDNDLETLELRIQQLKGHQGRHVNFICVGVENGFPTFLSMNLRKLYHNGDEGIPALYLIEYQSEKAFFNKFQTIKPYLKGASLLDVIPPCRVYPWEEPKTELYEGTWVITEENYVCINDKKFEVDPTKVGIENLVEIFRVWLQNLHLICLKDAKQGITNAKITLKEIHNQLDIYAKNSGIDLRKLEIKENTTFFESALSNFMKNVGQRVNWFIAEIAELSKGNNPQDMEEFEAAKRLQLGTITGKHQQKALALKNITTTQFKQLKQNFIELWKNTKFKDQDQQEELDPYPYTSNQFRKLLQESKFCEGFEYCSSQYDLFEAMKLKGISLFIKKTTGFEDNPWNIQIKKVPNYNKIVDSANIISNSMLLSLPVPNSEEKEEINCCLPLFSKNDTDILPLFKHQLIQMIVNNILTCNADAYYEDAYFSLLSHTYLVIIQENQDIANKMEIESAIFESFELFYSLKERESLKEVLFNEPYKFFNYDQQNQSSIAKGFLLIKYFQKRITPIVQLQLKKMFKNILIRWFHDIAQSNKYNPKVFYQQVFCQEQIIEEGRKQFEKSLYYQEFKDKFVEIVKQLQTEAYEINEKTLYSFNEKVQLKTLEILYKQLFNEDLDKKSYILFLYHVFINSSPFTEEQFVEDLKEAQQYFNKRIKNANVPQKGKKKKFKQQKNALLNIPTVQRSYKQLKQEYIQYFRERHQQVLPLEANKIKLKCEDLGIDFNQIQFSITSGLPRNMCLSPQCPFYFTILKNTKDKVQTELKKHLDNWKGLKPNAFHAIIKNQSNQASEKIYNELKETGFNNEKLKVTKEFTIDYIEKVRSKYENMKLS